MTKLKLYSQPLDKPETISITSWTTTTQQSITRRSL